MSSCGAPFAVVVLAFVLLLLLVFPVVSVDGKSSFRRMTVRVGSGKTDCFFLADMSVRHEIMAPFKVTDTKGATGNLDISVQLKDPLGKIVAEVEKQAEGELNAEVREPGDYQICLDNSYSSLSSKKVALRVHIVDDDENYYDDYYLDEVQRRKMRDMDMAHEGDWHISAQEVKDSLSRITMTLRTVSRDQLYLVYSYVQDMNMASRNNEKVTLWSVVHVSVLLAIGIVQVCMVRNLFADRSFAHRLMAGFGVSRPIAGRNSSIGSRPVPSATGTTSPAPLQARTSHKIDTGLLMQK